MGRAYAGVLGPLAFAAIAAHGVLSGGAAEPVLRTAVAALWSFALLGYVLGSIAGVTVEEAVRRRLAEELAERKAKREQRRRRREQAA